MTSIKPKWVAFFVAVIFILGGTSPVQARVLSHVDDMDQLDLHEYVELSEFKEKLEGEAQLLKRRQKVNESIRRTALMAPHTPILSTHQDSMRDIQVYTAGQTMTLIPDSSGESRFEVVPVSEFSHPDSVIAVQIKPRAFSDLDFHELQITFDEVMEEKKKALAVFHQDAALYYERVEELIFAHSDLWADKSGYLLNWVRQDANYSPPALERHRLVDAAIESLRNRALTEKADERVQVILSLEEELRKTLLEEERLAFQKHMASILKRFTLRVRSVLSRGIADYTEEGGRLQVVIVLPEKDIQGLKEGHGSFTTGK